MPRHVAVLKKFEIIQNRKIISLYKIVHFITFRGYGVLRKKFLKSDKQKIKKIANKFI